MPTSKSEQPTLVIFHDYTEIPGECAPGEEAIGCILRFRDKEYWLPLGPTHLILMDFLCRRARYCARDAAWIAGHIQLDPFVIYHGTNAPGHVGRPARTSRPAVRKQIERIRKTLTGLFKEEGLDLNAWDIVRSEDSSTKVVRYRINIDVKWWHLSVPGTIKLRRLSISRRFIPRCTVLRFPLNTGSKRHCSQFVVAAPSGSHWTPLGAKYADQNARIQRPAPGCRRWASRL
jgi:hypothetical protein